MARPTLSEIEIWLIGKGLCLASGVTPPPFKVFLKGCSAPVPQPLVLKGEQGRVWLDKYYVACDPGDGRVRYHYITRFHINETLEDIKEARLAGRTGQTLSEETRRAFISALRRMRATGRAYALFLSDSLPKN
ncbi:MAG: hypothetical protein II920_10055 [Clostridia bacterium]|nr:hypothetical protein [Clostridia bacterium]